mgnify:CR=1 FL=1
MTQQKTPLDYHIQALLDQYRSRAEANLMLLEEVLGALADADRANEFMVRRIAKALTQHAGVMQAPVQPPAQHVRPAGAPPAAHPQPQWRQ